MRRAVLNILVILQFPLHLSFTGATHGRINTQLCSEKFVYNGKEYSMECICGDSATPWCSGSERGSRVQCGLAERDVGYKIPQCGITVRKCPYFGYFYSGETGQCYMHNRVIRKWKEADADCALDVGAHLARMTRNASIAIKDYLGGFSPKYAERMWVGLRSGLNGTAFEWLGTYWQLTWQNWALRFRPSPDDTNNCITIDPNDEMRWNGANCAELRDSICEIARYCRASACAKGSDCVPVDSTSQRCCVNREQDYCFDRNNYCKNNPCKNGGKCVSMLDLGNRCNCANGFTGDQCETNIDECFSRPCSAVASQCIDGINEFQCTCRAGYTGVTCQTELPTTSTKATTAAIDATPTPSTTTPTTTPETTLFNTTLSIIEKNTTVDSTEGTSQNTTGSPGLNTTGSTGSDQGTAQGALNANLPESSGANRLLKMNTDYLYELSALVNVIFCLYCFYLIL